MLEAIEAIERYVDGVDLRRFREDEVLRDAVVYRLLTLGEAATRLPDHVTATTPDVPWRAVRGMRNRLAHEYFRVRVEVVWETATTRMEELRHALKGFLAAEE